MTPAPPPPPPPPYKVRRYIYNSGSGPSGPWLHTEVFRPSTVTFLKEKKTKKKKTAAAVTFHPVEHIPLFHSTIPFHHSSPVIVDYQLLPLCVGCFLGMLCRCMQVLSLLVFGAMMFITAILMLYRLLAVFKF